MTDQEKFYQREINNMDKKIEELKKALKGMLAIVSDSTGVGGYHLNGDFAEWDEFEEVILAEQALNPKP